MLKDTYDSASLGTRTPLLPLIHVHDALVVELMANASAGHSQAARFVFGMGGAGLGGGTGRGGGGDGGDGGGGGLRLGLGLGLGGDGGGDGDGGPALQAVHSPFFLPHTVAPPQHQ